MIEREIHKLCIERHWTLSLAESCTGGAIASRLVKIPDASLYFQGCIVAYSNASKKNLLEVSPQTISKYGAVSEKVAREMGLGALKKFNSDFALATTGVAGPSGGTPQKPLGTVCIALVGREREETQILHFTGNRQEVIEKTVQEALKALYLFLIKS